MVGSGLVVYIFVFLAWTYFHWGGPEHISLIGNLATFPPFLLATLMAWRVAVQPHLNLRLRRAWFLLGMGSLSVFIAEVIWTYLENVLLIEPFPSVADIFFLGFYPLVLGGLLTLPSAPQNRRERLVFWLDLIIVWMTASMFVGYFLIVPTAAVNNSDLLTQLLATAYPIGSLILLGGLAALLLKRPAADAQAILLLLTVSMSFFLASDLAFGYASLAGTYAVGSWVDVGWNIAQVFVVLAALRQLHAGVVPAGQPGEINVLNTLARALPWVAIILGYGLVIYSATLNSGQVIGGLLISAMLLTLLVIGRRIAAPSFMDLSLRTKLILTFVLVSGLSISLVALASYLTVRSNLESAVGANLRAQAQVQAQTIGNLLSKQFDLMQGVLLNSVVQDKAITANARYPSDPVTRETQLRQQDLAWKTAGESDLIVHDVLNNEVAGRLRDFTANFPHHVDALLTDKYGATIAATTRPIDYYQGDQDWWQAAYNRGQGVIYISQPNFDSATQSMRLIIAAPVYARRKTEVLGILRTIYHIGDVIELLSADHPGPVGEFDLLLPDGQMLFSNGERVSIDPDTLTRLQTAATSNSVPMSFHETFQLVSQAQVASADPEHASAFQNLNWTLVAHQEFATAVAPVNAAGQTALFTTLAVLLLTAGGAFLVAQWLVAPIFRLTTVATQIANGDLSVKARVESRDEIGALASTFNTMLEAQAYSQQELRQLFAEVERQKADLEHRVVQRTEELNGLNLQLQEELSERQRLVQSLRDSEARFRLLFEASPDAILLIDPNDPNTSWPIVDCNEAACTMNGYTRQELIGQSIDILNATPGDPTERRAYLASIRRHGILHDETFHRHKAGYFFPVEISTTLITFAGHELVLGIDRDITERKQTEVALREAKEVAEGADRAKSEFLSRMSHELRTPMNAILGFAQLLNLSRKEPLTPGQQERVHQIVKGGHHLLDLINEVLDISRIEAGRLPISPEPVRVLEILQEALDLTEPLAAHRNIEIQMKWVAEASPYVLADRQRLKQILLNLLSNAVKYNRDGGSVTVTCAPTANGWQISITDTGPGISPDNLGRLFTPFERLRADQSNIEGTGLGLALAKRLTELMQGQIGVNSVEGQGSTFWVELLAAESQLARLQRTGGTGPVSPLSASARTLLYVEDNLANYELIRQVLADYSQIELLWATEAGAGLELAHQRHPHLILLDLHLHGLDGADVLRQLKQDVSTSAIPVVVVSADATPGQIERLTALGAKAYLTKPLNVKHFVKLVEEILGEEAL